jgi:hypothetical protein
VPCDLPSLITLRQSPIIASGVSEYPAPCISIFDAAFSILPRSFRGQAIETAPMFSSGRCNLRGTSEQYRKMGKPQLDQMRDPRRNRGSVPPRLTRCDISCSIKLSRR